MKQQVILHWFEKNKRDLPWRKTDPWGVLVSEFMLQQTPVNRVLPLWNSWMNRWPTPAHLAAAAKPDVIKAWGKLGYPRRALRLHECAKIITSQYNNQVPSKYEELLALPGVGDYTAAAILSFAFQERALVLDINIRRFFARVIDGVESPSSSPSQIERSLREKLIPKKDAHVWAAATMEIGALICTAKSPKCELCPVSKECLWKSVGYPKLEKKAKPRFVGSDRQCRGVIMSLLRENERVSRSEIENLWTDTEQVEGALQSLISDGLIEILKVNSYRLSR